MEGNEFATGQQTELLSVGFHHQQLHGSLAVLMHRRNRGMLLNRALVTWLAIGGPPIAEIVIPVYHFLYNPTMGDTNQTKASNLTILGSPLPVVVLFN